MMRNLLIKALSGLLILTTFSCSKEKLENSGIESADLKMTWKDQNVIEINETDLFPEGIEYDKNGDRFLVSSVTRGDIGQVINGEYSIWISNPDFVSTLGLEINHSKKLVYITNSNIDGSLAQLFAYDLSGNLIYKADFGVFIENGGLANDVAVDNKGNAYVTDSYAGNIYIIDPQGNPEIFISDPAFTPAPGDFGLNGIDYDPRGYLIVSRLDTNQLFRIPLDDPESFLEIELNANLYSPDGLYLKNPNEILVVSNDSGGENARVQTFRTRDRWETATLTNEFLAPGNFLTTATVKRNEAYVLSAHLDILLSGGSTDEFSILKVN